MGAQLLKSVIVQLALLDIGQVDHYCPVSGLQFELSSLSARFPHVSIECLHEVTEAGAIGSCHILALSGTVGDAFIGGYLKGLSFLIDVEFGEAVYSG
jgi:hypothetical protein